ncbi:MAG: glycosyltransferase [Alphaproteobacteria bacterium]|nr:glycosyltransferase [Alphaproteobacteria bacterium]
MPKVSVLMPVYKTQEEHLRQAIESVLNQTYTDFEFLILDDCPDDTREDIVKSYQDKRIKYSQNEKNLGITPSRNKLIDMAQGEYLAVFDHDDISLPERFAKQVAYLDANKDVGVVSSWVKIGKRISKTPINDAEIKRALMRQCALTHPASMIRKSVLLDNKICYEEIFSPAEDYALWCRLIPHTNFHNIDEVLFHYRNHSGNTTHKQSKKMEQATFAIWSFVKEANPVIYNEFILKAKHTTRFRLFGIIPLLKTITQGNRTTTYLFGKLPLWSYKTVIKV